jgi:two-component system, sporulation sensor kinase E
LNPSGEHGPANFTAFEERFLSKLQKVDSLEIERFLNEVVRERSFLQRVFDAMADGLVVLKQNLEIQYLNSPSIELLGLNPRNRILKQRLSVLAPIEELRSLLARFALAPVRMDGVEIVAHHKSEPMLLSISLLPLENGPSGGGSILMVRDITALTRSREEHRRARQAATMATLSAGLAHEIKNPLNSLLLHAQLLRQSIADLPVSRRRNGGPDRERMSISVSVIVDEIIRLNAKVNEFLAAVRPTKPRLEPIRISQLLEHVSTTVRPEVEGQGIQLQTVVDHELPQIQADQAQLIQVLQNLVKNSMEALLQAPVSVASLPDQECTLPPSIPQIVLRAELAREGVALSVRDNGPGIPPEVMPRILEPYFTSKDMGTGLGLNIVSRIVEDHGGRLNVATRPLVDGTIITILLPLVDRPLRKLGADGAQGSSPGDSEVRPADLRDPAPES